VQFLRRILRGLLIGPVVQNRIESLHIENGCYLRVLSEALALIGNTIARPRKSRVPVSSLSTEFYLAEYGLRQAPVHSTPNQPTVTAIAQVLTLWNPEAKLNQPPVARRWPKIEAEFGPHRSMPVSQLIITSQTLGLTHPEIASGHNVERDKFASRPLDHPISSGEV
jgi:hypothetical protein